MFRDYSKLIGSSGLPIKSLLLFSVIIIPLTFICIFYVDLPLAQSIQQLLVRNRLIWKNTRNIPNILPYISIFLTLMMFSGYLLVRHRKQQLSHFFILSACTIPCSYLFKIFLQDAFGRTSIRTWLIIGGTSDFNWFHPLHNSGGFPSGHTAVFASFFCAVWLCYPTLRFVAGAFIALLGCSLVLTNYHFLSDVLAGLYAGVLITVVVQSTLVYIRSTLD